MEQPIESQLNQIIQPLTKLSELQEGLRIKFQKDKLLYEQTFKSMKLKTIQSISAIKSTQLKIVQWKLNKHLSDAIKQDILVLEKDIDDIKIQLISDIKDKVKEVRKINDTYNLCLNELIKLEILPNQQIEKFKDLPIKMLHENYVQGLPQLLIQSNILSPYLKRKKSQHKESLETKKQIIPNDNITQTQSI